MIHPKVTVIVPNWNGLGDTIECLESLRRVTYPNCDIVVIDNGSAHDEASVIREKFPEVHLLRNKENEGFVVANNQGLEFALKNNAEYALLLNNDTVVKDDFLSILVGYAAATGTRILAPKILYYDSGRVWSMGGKISYVTGMTTMIGKGRESGKYKDVVEPDFVPGCALLTSTEVVRRIGSLDVTYFAYYEDVDWCMRAKRAGYEVKVIPESIVWHKKSATAGVRGSNGITRLQAHLWARNGLIFGKKNLTGWRRLSFILGQLTFRFAFNLFHCDGREAAVAYGRGIIEGVKYKA